jgi:hypothetical protein
VQKFYERYHVQKFFLGLWCACKFVEFLLFDTFKLVVEFFFQPRRMMENEGKQWKSVYIHLEILILYDYSRFYYLVVKLVF